MKIVELLSEEFNSFDWLPGDIEEYIGRPDIKGLVVISEFTDEPLAALIWQIVVKRSDMSKFSRLIYFDAPDTPSGICELPAQYHYKCSGRVRTGGRSR